MKKIYMSIIFAIFIFFISCEINPFVGVGSTVDTIAPEIIRITPTNFSYVHGDFDLTVTCYDNILVTRAKLEIEKDNKKIFEKTENISHEKIAGYQTWKVPISLENDLKITWEQGGELKVTAYVYDERGNISENSYKSVAIVVDVDTAEADIYYPELFKKTKCEALRDEEINSENFTVFQNSTFQINGECNDNSSIQSVCLTLKNEEGEIVKEVNIDEVIKNREKYVSGSLYNWKLFLSASTLKDPKNELAESDIPLTKTFFYEVFLQVKDGAENVTFTEEDGYEEKLGKSFGWFAVRQAADYPFSDFSSISDKVSVNSLLTGKSYDDDGIAAINIYRKPLEAEEWELIKSYSEDGSNADESLEGTPQIFTWKVPLPENAASSNYQLKVEVIDIYGKSSIDGYKKNCLAEDRIFCSFGIVDPTAPSIEPIDLTDFKNSVDKDGNFTIAVKASDNSMVKKIYLAWKSENTEKPLQWNDFAAQTQKKYKDEENGIIYWNISPEKGAKEVEKSLILNIYDDFENIYDKKIFYVYAEDDSGKYTEITTSMPRFTEIPEVKFTSPISGAVETTYNNQKFTIEVEIYSYIKRMETIQITSDESKEPYNVDINELIYDESNKLWKYKCNISSAKWWGNNEGNGSHSLTAKVTDVFNNSNIDMLSFDIDNGVPTIKSVNAETEPGSYCAGSEIEIFVEMSKKVSVQANNKENLTLSLNNGGTAYYDAKATGSAETKKICFTYLVEADHNSGPLDAVSLNLNSARICDGVGNINGLDLSEVTVDIPINPVISVEKNSSSMLIIDNIPPKIVNVTSNTPNGSYTSGEKVNLIVEFDEKVTVSGKPILVLSKKQTAEYEKVENDTKLYFTYLVGSDVNIDLLEWEKLLTAESGIIKDCSVNNKNSDNSGNKVDFSQLQYSADISLAKSGRKIKIDNKAPGYEKTEQNYTNNELCFKIEFDEPVYKVAGKKAVLHRRADAVPIVLSVDKYNEYFALDSKIADYYEKGVNGASKDFKIDNTTKYILKYEYEPTDSTLLEYFKSEKLGFYTQEIMMESDWVKNDGNSIVITIPSDSLLTGENYWLTIDSDFAEDKVGKSYPYPLESTLIQAGNKAQPPVIRIQKITSGNAKQTKMKIDTITKDATIKYSTNGETPLTDCTGKIVELGTNDYIPATYKIKASAQFSSGDLSDYGYEVAYKTVIYTSHGVKTSGDEVYFRGANIGAGSATEPNFPFSWDEASSPEKWDNNRETNAAKSGMIKAAYLNGKYYVVSWGVTNTLYFKPLSCKNNNGKFVWAWGLGDCVEGKGKVEAGYSSDSNTDSRNNPYETNYHDKFGVNYK